uniref:Plant disease resistance polyprotein-like n=1 Tax=Oryza sativa subsp. japonica TaxID=39947 RepID=Q6H7D6_ORYSJ|nr:plant disease resistance polyprotein-like [Oryza sativa Japonica Group]
MERAAAPRGSRTDGPDLPKGRSDGGGSSRPGHAGTAQAEPATMAPAAQRSRGGGEGLERERRVREGEGAGRRRRPWRHSPAHDGDGSPAANLKGEGAAEGERGPDVAGSGGIRRPTRGSGEEREAGFGFRIPAISGAGASGRERGMGAEGAAHARTWPTWPEEGGDVGAAAVSGAAARRDRREEGDGTDRWAPPVGDPERGGGGRPGLPDWASACGRPSKEEGEEKGNGPAAHSEKK